MIVGTSDGGGTMSDGTTVKALLRLAAVMDSTARDLSLLAARARERAARAHRPAQASGRPGAAPLTGRLMTDAPARFVARV